MIAAFLLFSMVHHTCLLTYLPTYLPTYLLTYLPTYLLLPNPMKPQHTHPFNWTPHPFPIPPQFAFLPPAPPSTTFIHYHNKFLELSMLLKTTTIVPWHQCFLFGLFWLNFHTMVTKNKASINC
jgi:hypothetical protein